MKRKRNRSKEDAWKNELPEVGFIISTLDWPVSIVFQDEVDIFLDRLKRGSIHSWREMHRIVYPSVTDMLLAGWEVDRYRTLSY
jgi:hypothetical protein